MAKKRKKEEKLKRKFELRQQHRAGAGLKDDGVNGSGTFKLPDIYYEPPPQAGGELPEVVFEKTQQKGHGK